MRLAILEFIGGAWDGMNLCDGSSDPVEVGLARHVLRMTGNGETGSHVAMPSEYATRSGGCRYVITHHVVVEEQSLVRLECCEENVTECSTAKNKTIALRFVGGCLDGRTLRSDASDMQGALLAAAYYCLSDRGLSRQALQVMPALCKWFHCNSWCDWSKMKYRVLQRVEDEQSVEVILEHQADV